MEVHISLQGRTQLVGTLFREIQRRRELVAFRYDPCWIEDRRRFSLDPALRVDQGTFHPKRGQSLFGSMSDSAPDSWGRRLMRRYEFRKAGHEGRKPRTLSETDYLLGVSDVSRQGALRFKFPADREFQRPAGSGVPKLVNLRRLLTAAERIDRGEEDDEDMAELFAPGSSLGGARPKASVRNPDGSLAIAKFPKATDSYSLEAWERIALVLAERAGITTPSHGFHRIDDRPVLISRRFDRNGAIRLPYLSAMSMLEARDGERASYPEIVDELCLHGGRPRADAAELYRRMVFNILISNVDDHLRNHGFLWRGESGWTLAPAFDLNPTPTSVKARTLSTRISLDDGTCSVDLALAQASLFGLSPRSARRIVAEVGKAVRDWRSVAAENGETSQRIERMASAFEHEDLELSLRIGHP